MNLSLFLIDAFYRLLFVFSVRLPCCVALPRVACYCTVLYDRMSPWHMVHDL
jgi:hypothetical protein